MDYGLWTMDYIYGKSRKSEKIKHSENGKIL